MSRDSGAHGVQVVGGSNPPCPTNIPAPTTTTCLIHLRRENGRKVVGSLGQRSLGHSRPPVR
jgi:hypothetical protein